MTYEVRVWYAPYKLLPAIELLADTIHEREVLRYVLTRYCEKYFKRRSFHKVTITVTHRDFSKLFGRTTYFTALQGLERKGIIKVNASRGPKAVHEVSIITERTVTAIKANKWKNAMDLVAADTIVP